LIVSLCKDFDKICLKIFSLNVCVKFCYFRTVLILLKLEKLDKI
jgi:hypothetical protein